MDEWLTPKALLVALAIAVAFGVLQTARLAFRGLAQRFRLHRQQVRARDGEDRAEALLRDVGCRILGRQVATAYRVFVDGDGYDVPLRADYLVAVDNRRFVAEVKTGRFAPRLDTAATRRQLLEYRIAFSVDGVLLVDAEANRVHAVEFPLPPPSE